MTDAETPDLTRKEREVLEEKAEGDDKTAKILRAFLESGEGR